MSGPNSFTEFDTFPPQPDAAAIPEAERFLPPSLKSVEDLAQLINQLATTPGPHQVETEEGLDNTIDVTDNTTIGLLAEYNEDRILIRCELSVILRNQDLPNRTHVTQYLLNDLDTQQPRIERNTYDDETRPSGEPIHGEPPTSEEEAHLRQWENEMMNSTETTDREVQEAIQLLLFAAEAQNSSTA